MLPTPRELLGPCRGKHRGRVRDEALARVQQGGHPHSTEALSGQRIEVRGRPTPNQLAWLASGWWVRKQPDTATRRTQEATAAARAAAAQAAEANLLAFGGRALLAAHAAER